MRGRNGTRNSEENLPRGSRENVWSRERKAYSVKEGRQERDGGLKEEREMLEGC